MLAIIKQQRLALALFSSVLLAPLAPTPAAAQIFAFSANPEEIFPAPGEPPNPLLFGFAVAIDDSTALVSMPGANPPRIAVFTREAPAQWLRTDTIENEVGLMLALQGEFALAASNDGLAALRRTARGWIRTQAIDVGPWTTSLVMDGRVAALVSSPPEQPATVLVLYRDHRGRWFRGPTLSAPDGGDWGSSLALSNRTLVVGALSQNEERGAAYILRRTGNHWREVQKLLAPGDDTREFGSAVAASLDRIIIGAPGTPPFDVEFGRPTGAAFVFARKGHSWHEVQRLQPTGAQVFGQFLAATPSMLASIGLPPDRFTIPPLFIYEPSGPQRTYELKIEVTTTSFAGISDLAASGNTAMVGIASDSQFDTGQVDGYENDPTVPGEGTL
jgi:FG-GAP repeat protein